jgi:hypothetical protein
MFRLCCFGPFDSPRRRRTRTPRSPTRRWERERERESSVARVAPASSPPRAAGPARRPGPGPGRDERLGRPHHALARLEVGQLEQGWGRKAESRHSQSESNKSKFNGTAATSGHWKVAGIIKFDLKCIVIRRNPISRSAQLVGIQK